MIANNTINGSLMDNWPDGFAYHQLITESSSIVVNYIFLYINPAFEEIFGITKKNVIGKRATEVFPNETAVVEWIQTFGKVALNGKSISFDYYSKTMDRWYEVTAYSNKRGFFVTVYHDITRRKKMEMFLQRRLNLLSLAANTTLEVALQKALDEICSITHSSIGFFYLVSPDETTLTLKSLSTEKGKPFCAIEDQSEIHCCLEEAREWADCLRERRPIIKNDASPLKHCRILADSYVEIKQELVAPIIREDRIVALLGVANKPEDYTENDEQIVSYFADVVWEIAEDNNTQKALKESETLLQKITGSTLDAVLMMGPDGTISFWNPAAEKIFGYSREEALGQDLHLLLAPQRYMASFRESFSLFQQTGQGNAINNTLELEALRKDGQEIPIELSLSVLKLADGWHAVGIIRDITERKLSEKKIADYTMDIELQSFEMEIMNKRLDEEINKAKRLHEKTLPRLTPEIDGLEVYAHYQPATNLGGDYYGYIQLDDALLFYILDVTGHGLDAAMLSSFVKNTINTYVRLLPENTMPNPKEILNFLAHLYTKEGYPEDYFLCILLGVAYPKESSLIYSSAGLHVPLLRFHEGSITELSVGNIPISAVVPREYLSYHNEKVDLLPGSTLFISTDGLIEQTADNRSYGDRHHAILRKIHYLPPPVIAEVINEDFKLFAGKLVGDDDITFLILQTESLEKYPFLNLEIESTMEAANCAKSRVKSFLCKTCYDPDLILMALHELLINSLEHGNQYDPAKKIRIHVEDREQFLLIAVEDEGEGFDWKELKERAMVEIVDTDGEVAIKGRGLGFLVTKTVAHYFYYYFNETGNKATIINLNKSR